MLSAGANGYIMKQAASDQFLVALRRVLASPPLAEGLRARGQERARFFSWERTAAETLRVLEAAAS